MLRFTSPSGDMPPVAGPGAPRNAILVGGWWPIMHHGRLPTNAPCQTLRGYREKVLGVLAIHAKASRSAPYCSSNRSLSISIAEALPDFTKWAHRSSWLPFLNSLACKSSKGEFLWCCSNEDFKRSHLRLIVLLVESRQAFFQLLCLIVEGDGPRRLHVLRRVGSPLLLALLCTRRFPLLLHRGGGWRWGRFGAATRRRTVSQ